MRVAAIYDIHGNLPALEAVLQEIHSLGVDQVVVGGDVLPGPMPRECIDALRSLSIPTQFIYGNGDREVLAFRRGEESSAVPEQFREGMRWNARQLRPEDEHFLAAWPSTARLCIEPFGDVLFCHATPRNDTEIFTRLTPGERVAAALQDANASAVVCGHTHMQFDRMIGDVRVVNAGSVGMPFGEPGAYWLLLSENVDLRRTSYDLSAAATRIRASDYPGAEEFAARNVLAPPSEEQILTAYANAALR
ncbi:MAG: metallophosphoesterase family protein [Chthoniobacterales bacterium]